MIGWPAELPKAPFLAALYLGAWGGTFLGVVLSLAVLVAFDIVDLLVFVFGLVAGALLGVIVGALNGGVLAGLAQMPARHGRAGLSRNQANLAVMLTTGACSFGILLLIVRAADIFVYVPTIGATLLALPLSRKLPRA